MSNTSYNQSTQAVPFPNAYIGTEVKVDSKNSSVTIKSKNIDIGSTTGSDKIMNVNNTIEVVDGTTTDNTIIDLNSLITVKNRKTTVEGVTTVVDNIRLKSNDVKIGSYGTEGNAVLEIVNNQISFKGHKIRNVGNAEEDDHAVAYGQLNSILGKLALAINNLNSSLARVSQSVYGNALNNKPALEAYSSINLPSTNVDSTSGNSNIVDITLADILELE